MMENPDKPSALRIFADNWEAFKTDNEVIRKGIRNIVTYEVDKMMKCGTLESGFKIYEWRNCHKSHVIWCSLLTKNFVSTLKKIAIYFLKNFPNR